MFAVWTSSCVWLYVYTRVCVRVFMHGMCMCECTCVCVCVCVRVFTRAYARVCSCVRGRVMCTHECVCVRIACVCVMGRCCAMFVYYCVLAWRGAVWSGAMVVLRVRVRLHLCVCVCVCVCVCGWLVWGCVRVRTRGRVRVWTHKFDHCELHAARMYYVRYARCISSQAGI